MGKAFDQIMEGLEDVGRYMGGETDGFEVHVPDEVDVKAIRTSLGLSQPKFAQVLSVSVGRVRDWEQHRSPVDAPSRAFLTVLEFEPEAVKRAMAKASERRSGHPGRRQTRLKAASRLVG
jgi:putative transcriptional regulator